MDRLKINFNRIIQILHFARFSKFGKKIHWLIYEYIFSVCQALCWAVSIQWWEKWIWPSTMQTYYTEIKHTRIFPISPSYLLLLSDSSSFFPFSFSSPPLFVFFLRNHLCPLPPAKERNTETQIGMGYEDERETGASLCILYPSYDPRKGIRTTGKY